MKNDIDIGITIWYYNFRPRKKGGGEMKQRKKKKNDSKKLLSGILLATAILNLLRATIEFVKALK